MLAVAPCGQRRRFEEVTELRAEMDDIEGVGGENVLIVLADIPL